MAVADVIRAEGEMPSGELYAVLMPKISIETYQKLIRTLVSAELIRETNHLLVWIGPTTEVN
jgi:hypothetical protein